MIGVPKKVYRAKIRMLENIVQRQANEIVNLQQVLAQGGQSEIIDFLKDIAESKSKFAATARSLIDQ